MNNYQRWYNKNKEHARKYKREMMRKLRAENPEKYRLQARDHKRRTREKLFLMYGCKCAVCGFEDKRALTLDHIQCDGNSERKALGERGVYRKALEQHDAARYRILCMNCQFIERHKNDWKNRQIVAATAWRILSGGINEQV